MALKLFKAPDYDPGKPSINDILYEEIIVIILGNLPINQIYRFRRVCKYWHKLINENLLKNRKELFVCVRYSQTDTKYFRKNDLPKSYILNRSEQFSSLADFHENLQTLTMVEMEINNWFPNALSKMSKLTSLTLFDCKLDIPYRIIFNSMKNLTKLQLVFLSLKDDDVMEIIENLKQIQYLNLDRNKEITGRYLGNLPNTIKCLNLSNCLSLNLKDLHNSLKILAEKKVFIKSLNLKHVPFEPEQNEKVGINELLKNIRELQFSSKYFMEELCHDDVPFLNSIEKIVIYESWKYLSNYNTITNRFFKQFFGNNRQFKELKTLCLTSNFKRINDETFIECISSCPNLEYLKIVGFNQLTEKSFLALSNLRSLRKLKIVMAHLDNESTMKIIQNCPHLKMLVIDFMDYDFSTKFKERFIYECVDLFAANPNRKIQIQILTSFLPSEKMFTIIPNNLHLEIIKSHI